MLDYMHNYATTLLHQQIPNVQVLTNTHVTESSNVRMYIVDGIKIITQSTTYVCGIRSMPAQDSKHEHVFCAVS